MKNSSGKLQDKVAIITGAAQGIGAAIAKLMAREKASVILCDIQETKLQKLEDDIISQGCSAMSIKVDITVESEVLNMVDKVLANYQKVDILVNNAGVLRQTRIDKITKEEWDYVINVSLNGTFLCSKAVLNTMKKNKFGRIINMSSTAGRSVSTLGGAHYTTAKAAVLGLTRAMAKELAPYGITVNAICPGLIDTEMVRNDCLPEQVDAYMNSFPIQRMGTAEEVAQTALFLATEANYITGAAIDINGGDLMM